MASKTALKLRPLADRVIVEPLEGGRENGERVVAARNGQGQATTRFDRRRGSRPVGRKRHPAGRDGPGGGGQGRVCAVLGNGNQARRKEIPDHGREGYPRRISRLNDSLITLPKEVIPNAKANRFRRGCSATPKARRRYDRECGQNYTRTERPQRDARPEIRCAHDHA